MLENFLIQDTENKDSYIFKNNPNFFTFTYGKRNCVGKTEALKALYYTYANLMLRYEFTPAHIDNNNNNIFAAEIPVTQIKVKITKR